MVERQQRWPATTAAAGESRQLVASVLTDSALAGDVDLDTVALLVSELVTNALLHANTDVEVTCRVQAGRVRVDVRDWSMVMPRRRHYDEGAMTGRGLELVERLSSDSGVDLLVDGKSIWFEMRAEAPSGAPAEQWGPVGDLRPPDDDTIAVSLRNLPTELVWSALQYSDAMLRELAFLAYGEEGDGEATPTWHAPQIDIGSVLERVEQARAVGLASIELDLEMPRGVADAAATRLALVDEADRMAREGTLLTIPAVAEVGACRRWLFGQIVLQAEGREPEPWSLPADLTTDRRSTVLTLAERAAFDERTVATVVADDTGSIIHVNPAAAELLGWACGVLEGARLTMVIPPRLWEAHLAAYTRVQLTGDAHILGSTVRLPTLTADGAEVELDVVIEAVGFEDGRTGFVATMTTPG
jgi:PAS domain S-box-containing protein